MIDDDVMVDRTKLKIRREWTEKMKTPIKINKISQILFYKTKKRKKKERNEDRKIEMNIYFHYLYSFIEERFKYFPIFPFRDIFKYFPIFPIFPFRDIFKYFPIRF